MCRNGRQHVRRSVCRERVRCQFRSCSSPTPSQSRIADWRTARRRCMCIAAARCRCISHARLAKAPGVRLYAVYALGIFFFFILFPLGVVGFWDRNSQKGLDLRRTCLRGGCSSSTQLNCFPAAENVSAFSESHRSACRVSADRAATRVCTQFRTRLAHNAKENRHATRRASTYITSYGPTTQQGCIARA